MDSEERRMVRAAMRCVREGRVDSPENRWQREHMRTESTRFTIREDAELRAACDRRGFTRYELIRALLLEWLFAEKAGE